MNKWKMVKLGDVCDVERGGSPRPIDKFITEDISGINWIKIGDTSDDSMYITKTKQKIIPEGMKKSRYVLPGDFLLSNSMSFGRPYILKIDGCVHDGWLILRDKNNYFHKEFLYYALSSKTTYKKFKNFAVGGVVNNLNSSIVKQVEFPLPPLEIQKKIAKTLNIVAELLAMRKLQLAGMDIFIKSTFYKMFGDPVNNEKGWIMSKIEDTIANEKNALKAGPFGSALKKDFYVKQGYKIYGQEQVISNDASYGDYYISERKFKDLENCAIQEDDVLISLVGTYGKLLIIPKEFEKGIINPRLMKITFNKTKVNTTYFKYYFLSESMKNVMSGVSRGGTMDILNAGIVRKLLLPLPPLSLQTQFAAIVTKIEEQKALVKKAINETQYLFDSLMSEYFD